MAGILHFSPFLHMLRSTVAIVTALFVLVLGGLIAADALFADRPVTAALWETIVPNGETEPQNGVAPHNGPEVATAINNLEGWEANEQEVESLLSQIAVNQEIHSISLLKDGDRAGAIIWIETPEVKQVHADLKEALLASFSEQMKNLRDETVVEAGRPVQNITSFDDPVLSEDHIAFLRVRERLYEIQLIDELKDDEQLLIDALSQ